MDVANKLVGKLRKAIKDAVFELMCEKSFDQITVKEVLNKANISRGTFYAHFSNLENVRQQLTDDLFAQADKLFGRYKPSELAEDPYPLILAAADTIIQSRDPAKRIFKFINAYELGINLKKWLIKYILSDEKLVERMGGAENAKIYARFIAGGFIYEYNKWIMEDELAVTPELLARALTNIVMGGLSFILKPEAT